MDVHATLGIGIVTGDVPSDSGWRGLRGLLEGNGALDVGVTTNGCNYKRRATWLARMWINNRAIRKKNNMPEEMLNRNGHRQSNKQPSGLAWIAALSAKSSHIVSSYPAMGQDHQMTGVQGLI